MTIKKIISLLEKMRHYLVIGRDEGAPELIEEIDEALSELQEAEPEPTDFTKEVIEKNQSYGHAAYPDLIKACDIIDRQAAEIKELESCDIIDRQVIAHRIPAGIVSAVAEIKKLKKADS